MNYKFVNFQQEKLCDLNGEEYDLRTYLYGAILYFESNIDTESPRSSCLAWRVDGSSEALKHFFEKTIVDFGEGWRVWGRYFKKRSDWDAVNNISKLAQHKADLGEISEAISTLSSVRGLGFSYASKVARFMNPEAVVLDSILCRELGISEEGYSQFLRDCLSTSRILGVTASQVESGIFAWVQICRQGKKKRRWRIDPHQLHLSQAHFNFHAQKP